MTAPRYLQIQSYLYHSHGGNTVKILLSQPFQIHRPRQGAHRKGAAARHVSYLTGRPVSMVVTEAWEDPRDGWTHTVWENLWEQIAWQVFEGDVEWHALSPRTLEHRVDWRNPAHHELYLRYDEWDAWRAQHTAERTLHYTEVCPRPGCGREQEYVTGGALAHCCQKCALDGSHETWCDRDHAGRVMKAGGETPRGPEPRPDDQVGPLRGTPDRTERRKKRHRMQAPTPWVNIAKTLNPHQRWTRWPMDINTWPQDHSK